MQQSPCWTNYSHLGMKGFAFCENESFINILTRNQNYSLSWVKSSPHFHNIHLRSALISSFNVCQGLLHALFLANLPTQTLHIFIFSFMCAACPVHLVPLDYFTSIMSGEQWRTERGEFGVFNPPPRNSDGPPKSCQTQPDCENC